MTGRLPSVRGRHTRRSQQVRRASAGLSPARAGAILGMLACAAAIYGVTVSGVFGYERVEIAPLHYTDEAALRAAIEVPTGENLFRVRTEPLAERLRSLPTVRDVRVEVSLPDTLVVHVTEREPLIVWKVGDVHYLADSTGTLFSTVDQAPPDAATGIPAIIDDRSASTGALRVGAVLDPVDFDAARRLAALVPSDIGSVAERLGVTVGDANGFTLATGPGSWVAVFGFYTPTLRTPELIPGQVRLLRSLLAEREADIARIILADDQNGTYVPRPTPSP